MAKSCTLKSGRVVTPGDGSKISAVEHEELELLKRQPEAPAATEPQAE